MVQRFVREKAEELGPQFANIVVHVAHIYFWAFAEHFITKHIVEQYKPAEMVSQYSLFFFKVLFATTTLAPPTVYLICDLFSIIQMQWYRLKQQRRKLQRLTEDHDEF